MDFLPFLRLSDSYGEDIVIHPHDIADVLHKILDFIIDNYEEFDFELVETLFKEKKYHKLFI
jgi:hypothetical protein